VTQAAPKWHDDWADMTVEQKREWARGNAPDVPDADEPIFSDWDAMRGVADNMDAEDRAVVLGDLADAAGLLAALQRAPGMTGTQAVRLKILATHAKELADERDREYRILNGEAA